MARSTYVSHPQMSLVLAALTPPNRAVMKLCIATGLRISDALNIKTAQLKPRFTVVEMKTKKRRSVYVPSALLLELQKQAGRVYVFPSRLDEMKPRTRQAVYRDVRRAADFFRARHVLPKKSVVSPHTGRKIAAVDAMAAGGISKAQAMLNHNKDDLEVTLLYALADHLNEVGASRNYQRKRKKRGN